MAAAPRLRVDADRLVADLERLAEFGATVGGGVARVAYSPSDLAARDWLDAQCAEHGMRVERDPAGSTIAIAEGRRPELAPIAVVSHTDSVPDGGRYDGSLGVIAGIACVRTLRANGAALDHPLWLINFEAEEATMGGATLGSRALIGGVAPIDAERVAFDGAPVGEHMKRAGLSPERLPDAFWPEQGLAACLELHIEQGPVLDAEGVRIGIVEGVVGIRRYEVVFQGAANHAGTTPMQGRRDALVAAAQFISGVPGTVEAQGIVGTVGTIRVSPGAPNVIPGRVELDLELRGGDEAGLAATEDELRSLGSALGAEIEPRSAKPPVRFSPIVIDHLSSACGELDLGHRMLWSGAGHDAGVLATVTEAGMIFIPSREGVSHSPAELSEIEDCIAGADVLLTALVNLDAALGRARPR